MKYLLKKYIEHREVIGVCMMFCGLPIIYFLRDGLRLAPNSSIFTIAGVTVPIGLSLLFKDLKKMYVPNQVLYVVSLFFAIICFFYFILRDPYSGVSAVTEYFNFAIIFFFFLVLPTVSTASINKNFLPIALFICLAGSLMLLYSISKDPLYSFGQRASIRYRAGDTGNTGNPHVFSKVAFFGLILSTMLFKYLNKFKINLVLIVLMFLVFLVVLILTQTMITFITSFIFLVVFFLYNFNLRSFYRSFLGLLLKWYVLVVLAFGVYKASVYINENKEIVEPAMRYVSIRFSKVLDTFSQTKEESSKPKTIDASAVMRLEMTSLVLKTMEENILDGKMRYVFFGNGYKNLYVDVPLIEALDSYGIFMFFVYLYLYYYMTKVCFMEMKNPKSIATEFLAYGFIYFLVQNLTGGMIFDFNRWAYYALICRFIIPIQLEQNLFKKTSTPTKISL
jgi:hypothetical protein